MSGSAALILGIALWLCVDKVCDVAYEYLNRRYPTNSTED